MLLAVVCALLLHPDAYMRALLPVQVNGFMPVALIAFLIAGDVCTQLLVAPVVCVRLDQDLLLNVFLQCRQHGEQPVFYLHVAFYLFVQNMHVGGI